MRLFLKSKLSLMIVLLLGVTLVACEGSAGALGEQGAKGDQGSRGEQGILGLQGEVGPQGPTGPAGEVGSQGDPGIAGDRGPQGEERSPSEPTERPKIIVLSPIMEEGTPTLTILGSGFIADELIFIQVERPEGIITLEGVKANNNRAFESMQELPSAIAPGVYTLKALGTRGSELVTTPIQIVSNK